MSPPPLLTSLFIRIWGRVAGSMSVSAFPERGGNDLRLPVWGRPGAVLLL